MKAQTSKEDISDKHEKQTHITSVLNNFIRKVTKKNKKTCDKNQCVAVSSFKISPTSRGLSFIAPTPFRVLVLALQRRAFERARKENGCSLLPKCYSG